MATCSWLIPVVKITCFAQIGLNPRQFSKLFSFSLASRAHTLSFPPLPLPKPSFSSSILHQSSRKGMSFLLFSKYFKFLALVFLDFVFMMRYENMMIEYGFVDVLLSLIYALYYVLCCFVLCISCSWYMMFLCVALDSMEYKVCRDNHVSLILKHYMVMCFYTSP